MRKCRVWDFMVDFITLSPKIGQKWQCLRVLRVLPLFEAIRNHLKRGMETFSKAHLKLFRVISYKYSNLWDFFHSVTFLDFTGPKTTIRGPCPLRLQCGCIAVSVNWFFDIISSFFAKFKNAEHSLEPGETPSKSASHKTPNYVQRS